LARIVVCSRIVVLNQDAQEPQVKSGVPLHLWILYQFIVLVIKHFQDHLGSNLGQDDGCDYDQH